MLLHSNPMKSTTAFLILFITNSFSKTNNIINGYRILDEIDGSQREKITFLATKNTNLNPIPLSTTSGNNIHDIESLVRTTNVFRGKYTPSPKKREEDSETEFLPVVEFVRGSSVSNQNDDDDDDTTSSSLSSTTTTRTTTTTQVHASPYGLIGVVAEAYSNHHNLSIRPDDVWHAILSQLSFYIQARTEELRSVLVNFEGKKDLEISITTIGESGLSSFPDYVWEQIPTAFLELISDNIFSSADDKNGDKNLKDWYLPNFTTTTEVDKIGAAAAVMCTFQDYFTYTVNYLCGIPQITLHGTEEDWILLRERIDDPWLWSLDIDGILAEEWIPKLRWILDEFVRSSREGSSHNLDFWDTIMHSSTSAYSGKQLSGWITTFTFFDKDGERALYETMESRGENLMIMMRMEGAYHHAQNYDATLAPSWGVIDADEVNPNILSCPIKLIDKMSNIEYNSTLLVGQMAFNSTSDVNAVADNPAVKASSKDNILLVAPRIDWSIIVEKPYEYQEMIRPRIEEDEEKKKKEDIADGIVYYEKETFPSLCRESRLDPSCQKGKGIGPSDCHASNFMMCFSGNSMVMEQTKGLINIRELQIGDMVQSTLTSLNDDIYDATATYSRVYSFGHRSENSHGNFLQIHYSTKKRKSNFIELSPDHLLYVNDKMIPASMVQIGDRLMKVTPGEKKREEVVMVIKIWKDVRNRGLYAPFTESGTIIVNSILASNYITLQPNTTTLEIFGYDTKWNHHSVSHLVIQHFLQPILIWFYPNDEMYTQDGTSTWIHPHYFLFRAILSNNTIFWYEMKFGVVIITTTITILLLLKVAERIYCSFPSLRLKEKLLRFKVVASY